MTKLAWGNKVSSTFRDRVHWIADDLNLDASSLMACMAFETGETFRPDIRNAAGSGAIGLIQFMPSTASHLGTTTEKLGDMNAEDQLNYVWKYFSPHRDRLFNLGDIYMAILWPAGIGKPDDWNLFVKGGSRPQLYFQNKGLDFDKDGDVSRAEALHAVRNQYDRGMQNPHVFGDD
jgi:Transglycosylase SLT domain